jgi:hypothetical protein
MTWIPWHPVGMHAKHSAGPQASLAFRHRSFNNDIAVISQVNRLLPGEIDTAGSGTE